ncbi:MAG: hypothetical protein JWO59_2873 [Chloroflexi bacterium]|nr:hypothetical protein [Chloroflexota bacterium]
MLGAEASPLTAWANYYVIIGSSAGALTGLTFVVMTLIASASARGQRDGIATFTTPTVVHFAAALAIAAILSMPWHELWQASVLLGLAGLGGLGYTMVVTRRMGRMRRQAVYQPVLEDWLFHVVFPLISYVALVGATILLPVNSAATLFVIGAATIVLIFIGIHNAWDTVTYIVVERIPSGTENPE